MILIGGGKRIAANLPPASSEREPPGCHRRHAYFSSALRRMPPTVDAVYEVTVITYS
jgi:hypothetical protein